MKYYSIIKKNDLMPFVATWMALQIITVSEVSGREKQILYCLYVESLKMLQMNLFTKQSHKCRKQT